MSNWSDLIGKKIVAFRGVPKDRKKLQIQLQYILFNDKETFIELSEQDYYDYHDCSHSARILTLQKDAKRWGKMFNKELGFDEPNDFGSF